VGQSCSEIPRMKTERELLKSAVATATSKGELTGPFFFSLYRASAYLQLRLRGLHCSTDNKSFHRPHP
jgi:hypothetical protein